MRKYGTKSIVGMMLLSSGFSLVSIKYNTTVNWYNHYLFMMLEPGRWEGWALFLISCHSKHVLVPFNLPCYTAINLPQYHTNANKERRDLDELSVVPVFYHFSNLIYSYSCCCLPSNPTGTNSNKNNSIFTCIYYSHNVVYVLSRICAL